MSGTKSPWAARIDPAVVDRVRATVAGLQRLDPRFTAGLFTEEALMAWCERMETQYNTGNAWEVDPAKTRLRSGPRL